MHIKFAAIKTYDDTQPEVEESKPDVVPAVTSAPATETNPDEIDLDMDDDDEEDTKLKAEPEVKKSEPETKETPETSNEVSEELRAQLPASFARPQPKTTPGQPVPPGITNKEVRFLALDKCLPGRHFLQLCELQPFNPETSSKHPPAQESPRWRLQYDPEWLAITRVFHDSLVFGDRDAQTPPDKGEEHYLPLIEKEREWVEENVVRAGKLDVPYNFEITAPPYVPGTPEIVNEQPAEYTNPQTTTFCEMMGLSNVWDATEQERRQRKAQGPPKTDQRFTGGRRGGGQGRGRGGGRGRGRGRGRGGRW